MSDRTKEALKFTAEMTVAMAVLLAFVGLVTFLIVSVSTALGIGIFIVSCLIFVFAVGYEMAG